MSATPLSATYDAAYERRIDRLIAASADGHDAFADIDWDTELDPEDPRLRPFSFDPLARTAWYVMVLGGEIPIDHVQRRVLKEESVHPLVRRIMEIHVEEEARHVAFAGAEIRRMAPELSALHRRAVSLAIPGALSLMAPLMVNPSPWLVRHYDIPRRDLALALADPASRALLADSVAHIRTLCVQQGLTTPNRWCCGGVPGCGRTEPIRRAVAQA